MPENTVTATITTEGLRRNLEFQRKEIDRLLALYNEDDVATHWAANQAAGNMKFVKAVSVTLTYLGIADQFSDLLI